MSADNYDKIHTRNVVEFLTIANEYCIFLEEMDKYDSVYTFSYLQKILPLLYLKGSLLPDISVNNEEANERFVTQEEWETIFNRAKTITLKDDKFYFLNNAESKYDEIQEGLISEFLADIYQDIKDFLLLYHKNTITSKENAVYFCKLLFEHHWGVKLLNLHKAIHQLVFIGNASNDSLFSGFSSN